MEKIKINNIEKPPFQEDSAEQKAKYSETTENIKINNTEKQPSQENIAEREAEYYEKYKIKESDLKALEQGIDTLAESKLLEEGILDDIRFVTYDSGYLYIFTRGQHVTNCEFEVEEIPSSSKTGFKIFKIQQKEEQKIGEPGFVGRTEESYRGGVAWLLRDEIETTAINARKFPNQDVLLEQHDGSKQPQPEEILDVVCIPPIEPFNKIWTSIDTKGQKKIQYNYLTDIIFHEAGHIEHRRLKNWQKDEGRVGAFPSEEQKEKFLSIIRQTKIFPTWITELIIANIKYGRN